MDYKIAIDVIESLKGNMNVEYVENGDAGCDLAIEALEKQITNRWISVNEKLPEKYGTYLVAWRPLWLNADDIKRHTGKNLNHYYEMLEFDPDDESGWVSSIEQCEKYVLLAWRELPEPYVD